MVYTCGAKWDQLVSGTSLFLLFPTYNIIFFFLNLCVAPTCYWHIVHAHLDLPMKNRKLAVGPGCKSAVSDFWSLFSYPHPVTSVMPSSFPPQDLYTCYSLRLELFPSGVSHGCLFGTIQALGQVAPWRRVLWPHKPNSLGMRQLSHPQSLSILVFGFHFLLSSSPNLELRYDWNITLY